MEDKYVLTPVDRDGYELTRESFGGEMYIEQKGYIKILINEEQSKFMENFCDIIIYPHSRVYVINNQRYTKKLYLDGTTKQNSN